MSDAAKTDLPKAYDPSALERRWYAEWLDKKYFHAAAAAPKAPFSLVIPPPNVTGSLHMGHALGRGIEDIFARWRRMAAYNTMWLPGTDHAGIATQLVVERDLKETEGKSRHDLGREAFIERVWSWRQKSGDRILDQLR
jgi:valyl-tRNA synthetase